MKTNTKNTNKKSGLKSRPEQLSTGSRPKIDFVLRQANRKLETEKLLALLRSETPSFFELAEVVGKWVWIQFTDKQPPSITRVLAELGFHWNNTRQTWQHSLRTKDEAEALTLLHSKNEAHRQPVLNLQIARTYAWAERARVAGMPERFAQEALGHNSKAVHRAYAKRALVKVPSLEEYEAKAAQLKLVAA